MAYNFPRNPRKSPEETPEGPQLPGIGDIWDTIKAPMAGLWQGLVPRTLGGKNLNFEEYVRQQARKRRFLNRGNYRRVAASNWLTRTTTGK